MKNCEPPLSGRFGASTAATAPRVICSLLASNRSSRIPPVPYRALCAGSFDSGSPPWMIPLAITRWKIVPVVVRLRAPA